jgi:hypothetical protein
MNERLLTEKEQDKAVKGILDMLTKDISISALSQQTIKFASYDAISQAQDAKTAKIVREELIAEIEPIIQSAIETIKIWHNVNSANLSDEALERIWNIYLKMSPEMTRITNGLQQLKQKEG